jgi:hypothetical protein
MGRGRQKAKHQKVARELKYHTSTIDVTALERELAGGPVDDSYSDRYDDDEDDDPFAAYTGDDEDDDED